MKPYDLLEREVRAKQRRLRWMRIIRAVVVLAALVGLNQACVYAYGTVRLAQAKSLGVYPTPEEAARAVFNHPVDDVQVERFGGVNCGPNDPFGRQPFVWFCTARVKYDRVPDGSNSREFLPGSFFFQVQDGWVYMGEDLFLGVVTLAMERYHLEGVR